MVTGVGAIIGYGIIKSLRDCGQPVHILGTDIYENTIGEVWADEFEIAPLTSSDGYFAWLKSVIEKYNIDILFPGIEQDVHFLSNHYQDIESLGCKVVINSTDLIFFTKDKWLMHQELLKSNIDVVIPTRINGCFYELEQEYQLPFLLKPRTGYASKGIVKINNEFEYTQHQDLVGSNLMAQPIIGTDDEEYTVAIFGDGNGEILATISLRRTLSPEGATASATVVNFESLNKVVSELCKYFKPIGPTNLQFRRTTKGWKLLEINPRFSSTTSIRSAFGYNEALMALEFYCLNTKPVQPKIKSGSATRYIEDYIVYDRDNF